MVLYALCEQLVYLLVKRLVLQQSQMLLNHVLVVAYRRPGLYQEGVVLNRFGNRFLNKRLQQRVGQRCLLEQLTTYTQQVVREVTGKYGSQMELLSFKRVNLMHLL